MRTVGVGSQSQMRRRLPAQRELALILAVICNRPESLAVLGSQFVKREGALGIGGFWSLFLAVVLGDVAG
jgi:hypothetical protein